VEDGRGGLRVMNADMINMESGACISLALIIVE
jgi:hypothetical protein